jgi:peroxiredoxin
MSSRFLFCCLALGLGTAFAAAPAFRQADPTTTPGRQVAPFRLNDVRDNKLVDLADSKGYKATVVLFLGTECPINNDYLPELSRLHADYAEKGVRFVAVNSNSQDSLARVAEHARRHKIPFPVVKDPGNKVADDFQARRTPEAFVLSPALRILYQGRIDDQFGYEYRRPGRPHRRDLAQALDEVLAGKPVSVARTEVAGCFIGRVRTVRTEGKVTFTRDISRILQKNCQECHRPGQIGPMPLFEYEDVVAWGETIREVVSDNRMPPWYADPKFGKWANDRRLSKEEKDLLLAWIDEGMPRGNPADLPAPRQFPKEWQIGEPDVVLTMPKAFEVPAETPKGGVPYKYFTVPTNFTEDRWIQAAEARPGAPEVVHHIIIFILAPGEVFRPDAPGAVLTGTAPGEMPLVLPPGQAKKIPAGARLLFQMHYTPNGKAQSDRSSVALIFAKQPPKHRILTNPIHNRLFISRLLSIPPGADNHRIEASHTFREDVHLVAFMPHMHLRGKDFRYEAHYPDGRKEILLSVPRYNFNWQTLYRPEKPIALPKGTTLHCVAHFDNSDKNPQNPDPTERVYWGDQTWQEMMVGWIDYYRDNEKP